MPLLKNKVAIVTGAAHGIGRAIAELFAAEGAYLLAVDIDPVAGQALVETILAQGGQAQFAHADVASPDDIHASVNLVAKNSSAIDVLVNNAAHLSDWTTAADATAGQWDHNYEVTLRSAALFTRAVLPYMLPQTKGSIVNIASIHGLVAGRNSAAYTSMKHGLIGLTRSTALDFGAQGIRANAICPGAIHTRISPPPGSELHTRQITKTMLGRIGEPGEVAAAALFLATDQSSYITGATLPVDGGWTAF